MPNDYRDLAVLAARLHGNGHRAAELRPGTLLETLEALDAFRRPERLEQFVLTCEADFAAAPATPGATIRRPASGAGRFGAARAVDTAALAAGRNGPEVGERIRQARIAAIKMVMTKSATATSLSRGPRLDPSGDERSE